MCLRIFYSRSSSISSNSSVDAEVATEKIIILHFFLPDECVGNI